MLDSENRIPLSRQSRFDLRMSGARYALVFAVLALLSCTGRVFLSISGPPEWEGAIVKVDGLEIGRMNGVRQEGEESFSSSGVFVKVPLGQHVLTIEKEGYAPYRRETAYEETGEDYINLKETPQK